MIICDYWERVPQKQLMLATGDMEFNSEDKEMAACLRNANKIFFNIEFKAERQLGHY
jgi:hypothetical protein